MIKKEDAKKLSEAIEALKAWVDTDSRLTKAEAELVRHQESVRRVRAEADLLFSEFSKKATSAGEVLVALFLDAPVPKISSMGSTGLVARATITYPKESDKKG